MNQRLNVDQNQYCSLVHKQKIVYIIKDSDKNFPDEVFTACKADRNFKDDMISVSDNAATVEELDSLYKHASVALEINSDSEKINRYEDLGIYKILVDVKDKKILTRFYDDTLGKLNQME